MFRFLTSKAFFINLLILAGIAAVSLWLTMKWLDSYTFHGTSVAVPDFKGVNIDNLDEFVADKEVGYEIIDSVFDLSAKKGAVLDQNPKADSRVKKGRKIYLTVNAQLSERIRMPELAGLSLRQAKSILASYDLRIDSVQIVPSIEKNAVLKQIYRGKPIKAGTSVPRGASIVLVAGGGIASEKTFVPLLYGLTLEQAREKLEANFLNLGATVPDPDGEITDTSLAVIYNQTPKPTWDLNVYQGSSVDVYYTNNASKVPSVKMPAPSDSTLTDTENPE